MRVILVKLKYHFTYNTKFTCRKALFDAETAWVLPTKLGTANVEGFDWNTGLGGIIGANVLEVTPSGFNDGVTTVTEGVRHVFCCCVGEWVLDGTAGFDNVVDTGNNDAEIQ